MSGGSWDYFCYKLSYIADCLRDGDLPVRDYKPSLTEEQQQSRKDLAEVLHILVPALKAVEWTDSDDSSNDVEEIKKALEEIRSKLCHKN
jgi:hypothetical protein